MSPSQHLTCLYAHTSVHFAGAQLAGSQLHIVASSFIDCLNTSAGLQFRGVVFFLSKTSDRPPGIDQEGWYVMDPQKRITMKSRSPISEADTFVIFDEARCRYLVLLCCKIHFQAILFMQDTFALCYSKHFIPAHFRCLLQAAWFLLHLLIIEPQGLSTVSTMVLYIAVWGAVHFIICVLLFQGF